MCEDPAKFTSHSDSATTVPDGYEAITDLPRADGYIGTFGISTKGYSFPNATGGSSNKGGCDYFYHPGTTASGWYGALLSAYAFGGARAGFGSLATSYRSSGAGASFGFRLCRN